MKRCPECRRDYYDDTLSFCLEDGATLVYGVPTGEPQTAVLSADGSSNEPGTRLLGPATSATEPTGAGGGSISNSRIAVALGLFLVLAVGIGGYLYYGRGSSRDIESIAVLPFLNVGGNPETEYLSEGISEALINSLTELQQLKVIARATAFRYKGADADPQAVGRELNVGAVLMGRVRQAGDSLNVQVDLIDASTGAQLWGKEYERKVSDILAIKQAITREVTENLKLRLSSDQQSKLNKRDTTNSEAYQFYLRGRYFWNKRTAEGIKRALQEFQQAIERDPGYALGYVGLADSYLLLEDYADEPADEVLPKAKAAVERALQIDETLAEAHTSLALIYEQSWDWKRSAEEYNRAISLNPNYATARHWYSINLKIRGRYDEAMTEILHAQNIDPLSVIIGHNVAVTHLTKNEIDPAIEQFKKVIELDPTFPAAHHYLGFAYLKQGRNDEALAAFQAAVELSHGLSRLKSGLGYCYAVTGRRAEALQIVQEIEEKYNKQQASAVSLAVVFAGLEDKDKTFAWLEAAVRRRAGDAYDSTWFPAFEKVRTDERYSKLLGQMGLQQNR
jgi:TolB-like protein/Tfp pilus assembly protein PilF